MKSLSTYIKESCINESSDKFYRLSLNSIEGGKDVAKSIAMMSIKNGFYAEITNDGVKVKFNDSNIDKVSSVIELINTFISGIPSENHSEIGEQLNKLTKQLEVLSNYIEEHDIKTDEKSEEK
jgi:hypothetical protein